jgi:hypothetical protein
VVSTLSAIAVNEATGQAHAVLAWAAVVALTGLTVVLPLLRHKEEHTSPPEPFDPLPVQSVSHSVVFGNITQNFSKSAGRFVAGALLLVVAMVAAVLVIVISPRATAARAQAQSPQQVVAPPTVPAAAEDIQMHNVWASSSDNTWLPLAHGAWVMTDFAVTLPYIRSVEVAAASSAPVTLQLRILDDKGNEIDSGEAPINDYRVKYVFAGAVDVHKYLGKRLYLQLVNITDFAVRAYLTRNDRDPTSTVAMSCGRGMFASCPPNLPGDLDALVVGRKTAW